MNKDYGPPAFPRDHRFSGHNGMTLRDYFAAQAMQGIVGSIDSEDNYIRLHDHARNDHLTLSQWIARDAYKQADAMLAARQPQPNGEHQDD